MFLVNLFFVLPVDEPLAGAHHLDQGLTRGEPDYPPPVSNVLTRRVIYICYLIYLYLSKPINAYVFTLRPIANAGQLGVRVSSTTPPPVSNVLTRHVYIHLRCSKIDVLNCVYAG